MNKFFLILSLIALMFAPTAAQKISKPTLTPTEPTAAQRQLINEGTGFHDRKLYDEAIKNYDAVLRENPSCITAMYEKSISLYYKKDFDQMLSLAYEGTKYISSELPLFYGLIANVYDDQGNPEKAVELYKQGISVLEGNTEYKTYLSSLYYNLGVTKVRQRQFEEARKHLKQSVSLNFSYASPNHLLAQVYKGSGYKIPALLAAARLISLEYNTPRTQTSVAIFKEVLNGRVTKSSDGKIIVNLNLDSPKDEGDFTSFDLVLGTMGALETDADNTKDELDKFADSIDTLIGLLAENQKLSTTFVGTYYIPFMAEMKAKGYIKAFACLVLYLDGDRKAGNWLKNNELVANDLLKWAKYYNRK